MHSQGHLRLRRTLGAVSLAVTLLIGFCAVPGSLAAGPELLYTQEEAKQMLRAELDAFEEYVTRTMGQARGVMERRRVSAEDLDALVKWQQVQMERLTTALHQEDPLAALVDAWAVTESMYHVADGHAQMKELPASARDVVMDALGKRRDRLSQLARAYLPPDAIPEITKRISDFADSQPVGHDGALPTNRTAETSWMFSLWQRGQSTAKSVLSVPLSPVRAMTGIGEGGKALSDMRDTTAQAIVVAEALPERIRQEVEALLDKVVSEQETLRAMLGDIHGISTNARVAAEQARATAVEVQASLNTAREVLPAGEALAASVERAARASTELVQAITGLVAQAGTDGAADEADPKEGFDIAEYQRTAESIHAAAGELCALMIEIRLLTAREPQQAAPPSEDHHGFDIREYRDTAQAIERGAAEIRAAIADVRDMGNDGLLRGRTTLLLREFDRSAENAAAQMERLIDHIFWRLVEFAAVICLVALFVAARKARQRDQARDAKGTK